MHFHLVADERGDSYECDVGRTGDVVEISYANDGRDCNTVTSSCKLVSGFKRNVTHGRRKEKATIMSVFASREI